MMILALIAIALIALALSANAASVTVGYCFNQGDCTGPNTTISYDPSKKYTANIGPCSRIKNTYSHTMVVGKSGCSDGIEIGSGSCGIAALAPGKGDYKYLCKIE